MTSPNSPLNNRPFSVWVTLLASVAIASPTLAAPQPESNPESDQPSVTRVLEAPKAEEPRPTIDVDAPITAESAPSDLRDSSKKSPPVIEAQEEESPAVPTSPADNQSPAIEVSEPEASAKETTAAEAPEAGTAPQAESADPLPEVTADSVLETEETVEKGDGEPPESQEVTKEESEATEEQKEEAKQLTPEELARQQKLIEADALLANGEIDAAEAMYRQAKDPFAEAVAPRAEAFSDPEQLSPGGKVYWRESAAGLEKNLKTRALVPAKLMVEKYPEFVPAYLRYAEALEKYDQLGEGLAVLERGAARYPNEPELQKSLIDFQVKSKRWLEASITARQFALLNPEHPEAEMFKGLAEQYQTKYRKVLRQRITSNAIAGVFTGALNVVLTGNPLNAIPTVQSSILLLRGENAVGRSAAKRAKKRLDMVEDPEVQAYVDRIGQKLVAVTGREMEYEFNIIKDERLNAFALPGGKIFINAGAITKSHSEAELAGLMAHELSHTVLSHGFQLVTDGTATTGITSLLPFGSLFSRLALSDYSRDMEEQADLLGTRMLTSAGYAADGLRNLMVTLGKEKTKGPKPPAWLSTHPRNKKRVRYLEELIEENGYNRYTYEGVAEHLKMQERVQAILDAAKAEEEKKKLDDEIDELKDKQDAAAKSEEKTESSAKDMPDATEDATEQSEANPEPSDSELEAEETP